MLNGVDIVVEAVTGAISVPSDSDEYKGPSSMEGGYLYPDRGGCVYQGRRFTEHALERMAACTSENVKLLLLRAYGPMESHWLEVEKTIQERRNEAFQLAIESEEEGTYDPPDLWWKRFVFQLREIAPDVVEREIQNPGTTDIQVVIGKFGDVITTFRQSQHPNLDAHRIHEHIRIGIQRQAAAIERRYPLYSDTKRAIQQDTADSIQQAIKARRDNKAFKMMQTKGVELEGKFKMWEQNLQNGKEPVKTLDLAAWKAARKTKQGQMAIEASGNGAVNDTCKSKAPATKEKKAQVKKEIAGSVEAVHTESVAPFVPTSWEDLIDD